MPNFFISYSRSDGKEIAKMLKRDISLLDPDNDIFVDSFDIRPGTYFETEITKAIKKYKYFIVLISADAANSEWVQKEIEMVRKSELETGLKKMFVVKFPEVALPPFVPENIHYLELTDNWTIDFYRLMNAISSDISFFSIEEDIKGGSEGYAVKLWLGYEDVQFKQLVGSVEYRFDHEFYQEELDHEKVVLKKNGKNNFQASFWTNQTVTVFIAVYLINGRQANFIHKVQIG